MGRSAEENRTFRVSTNAETGRTLVASRGELHLDIIREKLALDHGVEATTGQPRIAYYETITCVAVGWGKQVQQSDGGRQFAKVPVQICLVSEGG